MTRSAPSWLPVASCCSVGLARRCAFMPVVLLGAQETILAAFARRGDPPAGSVARLWCGLLSRARRANRWSRGGENGREQGVSGRHAGSGPGPAPGRGAELARGAGAALATVLGEA